MSIMSDIMPTPSAVLATRAGREGAAMDQRRSRAAADGASGGGRFDANPTANPIADPGPDPGAIPTGEARGGRPGGAAIRSAPTGEADAHGLDRPGETTAEFGFFDLLDVLNPLQHLPVVGGIYREITGDAIAPAARASGGFLWGGPIGLVASTLNIGVEAETGRDLAGNALAHLTGGDAETTAADGTALAMEPASEPARDSGPAEPAAAATETPADGGAAPLPANFTGAAAARLDSFVRAGGRPVTDRAEATAADPAVEIRRSLKLDPPEAATARVDTGAADRNRLLVSGPAADRNAVGDWMTQALDRYDRLRAAGGG